MSGAPVSGAQRRAALLLVLAVAVVVATLLALALRTDPAPTPAQRAHAVAASLKCPVCADLSVADSPSEVARAMRERIAGEIAAGRSDAEVRAGFVATYGETVLLAPPARGSGLVPWSVPVLAVAVGGAVSLVVLRRWRRTAGGCADAADALDEEAW